MFSPEVVLHATDFSDSARSALRYAVSLAQKQEAELHVLHVITDLGVDPIRGAFESGVDEEAYYERLEADAKEQMEAVVAEAEAAGVSVTPVIRRNPEPEKAICDYADEQDAGVVAMGTHGRRALSRVMLGSVAESVVRQAPCSVLTVREGETPDEIDIEQILTPIDLSEYSAPLIRTADDVAETFEAVLDILHVVEPLPFPVPLVGGFTLNDLAVEPTQRAEEHVDACVERAGDLSSSYRLHVEEGHAAMTILDTAEELDTDLICIASHGISGVTRMLVGSVTARVVRRSACPVLTLRVEPEARDGEEEAEEPSSKQAGPDA